MEITHTLSTDGSTPVGVEARRPVPWPFIAAPVVTLILVFPLQAIVLAMLGAVTVMTADVYKQLRRHRLPDAERETVDRYVVKGALALIGAGMVCAFLFPMATAEATLFSVIAVAIVWSGVWLDAHRLARRRRRLLAFPEPVTIAAELVPVLATVRPVLATVRPARRAKVRPNMAWARPAGSLGPNPRPPARRPVRRKVAA